MAGPIVFAATEPPASSRSTPDDAFSDYLVDLWTTEDGLPGNTITGIAQTPDGYLWCGTHDGIVRFDGVRFLRIGPDDPVNQQANRVLCLYADRSGRLWLGTDGAGLMHYKDGNFVKAFAEAPGSSFNVIRCITEDLAGVLWFGTRGGVGQLKNGRVAWLTEANGFTNAANSVWSTAFDHDGQLWVADWVSLRALQFPDFRTHFLGAEARVPIRAVHVDRGGNVWVGTMSRIWRRDPAGEWSSSDASARLANAEVVAFCEGRAGDLWAGTRKGLRRFSDGRWNPVAGHSKLARAEIRALFEDREGNLWVGTGTAGLGRIKRRVLTTYTARDGLTDDAVLALRETPEGRLWVGLSDGRLMQGKPGDFRPFDGGVQRGEAPVECVMRARDGAVWVGTFGDGVMRFHEGSVTRYLPAVGTFARIDKITALFEDRAGNILAGSYYGLYKVVASNVMSAVPIGGRELRSHVTALLEDREGALWIASHGLGVARLKDDVVTWVTRRDGLPTDLVRTLHEGRGGRMWIGTAAGLCYWQDGKLSVFTTDHGLLDNTISQVLEDEDDNLWLGSNRGLMRIAKDEFRAVAAGRKSALEVFACGRGEGMLSAECSHGFFPAGLKTRDGKLWFPTAKGLVMVDPAELKLKMNLTPPPVRIEEIRADGKPTAAARDGAAAELPYGTRRLDFVYTALSLTAPERVRFKYRLDGFDSDWTEAGVARSATYSKLSPGEYRFQVIACNNDGIWNEAGDTFAFRIHTPFWQRGWFLSIAGIAAAGSLGGIVRFFSVRHLRRKLRRLEEAHAVEKERMRIAQDMHDEIGGKLSRISFLSDIASRNLGPASDVSQQIDQVSEAARDVIRTVDEIVWAVSPRNDTLESLAHYICRHAEEFFELTPVELELQLPEEFPARRLSADVRHNLFCAVKEALNNVLKHAAANRVQIAFAMDDASLRITIEDNGRGFEVLAPVTSNGNPAHCGGDGLLNMRERLASIGGECAQASMPGKGTSVTFAVPLRDS
ncbi:MAG: histidine kinase [Verrucomicrobia subdivision 3 bacterium]|nr:histidine kinase [Limisphaerales bacterium]